MDHAIDDFSLGDRVRLVHSESAQAGRIRGPHVEGEIVSINRDLATVDVNLTLTNLRWPQRLTVRPWELEKIGGRSN
ncbi:MAG TPA: hypothetical protein VKI18_10815 [Albitalea sp.]|nr:hypothetical protein [Albitalea sp.]